MKYCSRCGGLNDDGRTECYKCKTPLPPKKGRGGGIQRMAEKVAAPA